MGNSGRWMVTSAAIAAAGLIGCGPASNGALNKAGADAQRGARVLTMATTDLALPDDPGLAAFPKLVEKRSGGRLRIRLELTPAKEIFEKGTRSSHIREGEADLGWDSEGLIDIPAWRVPFLPFLVDSYPLQRALYDGRYDEQLLEAFEGTPLVGVAVLSGAIARPWSLRAPIRTASDWEGVRMFTPLAHFPVRDRALREVGVEKVEEGLLQPKLFRGGRLDSLDWISLGLQSNGIGNYGVVGTLNVATATRPLAIIGNRRRLVRLSEREREWLVEAGSDATRVSLERIGAKELEVIAANCRSTAMRGVVAPERDLKALREKVRPVYAAVSDPRFRALYELVEATRASRTSEPVQVPQECRGEVPDLPVVERSTSPRALDGEYRFELNLDGFRDAGMADDPISRDFIGQWTARLENGRGTLVRRSGTSSIYVEPIRVELEYAVADDRVTFDSPYEAVMFGDPAPPVTVRWGGGPGGLSFAPLYPLDWFHRAMFAVKWQRVR